MSRILIIEDNNLIRENIEELLSLSDFQVITAENGQKGIISIQTERPDLILCDISMPKMNGYQVLEITKSQPETATIPFIFMTSKAQKKDIQDGLHQGADSYLTKPFLTEDLMAAIDRFL